MWVYVNIQTFAFNRPWEGGCSLSSRATRFNTPSPLSVFYRSVPNPLRPKTSHETAEGHDFSLLQRRKEIDSERSIKIRLVATLLAYLKTFKTRNSPPINICTRCPDFMRINIPRCAWLWRGRNRPETDGFVCDRSTNWSWSRFSLLRTWVPTSSS